MPLTPEVVDQLVNTFRTSCHSWEASLSGFASRLFWILGGIEFTWTAIQLSLKKAEEEEWLAAIVGRVLYLGFFWALLTHSSEWCQAIIKSFRDAGSKAGGLEAISPANIIILGLNATFETWSKAVENIFTFSAIVQSIGAMLAVITIVICFGLMAAFLVEALIESYIVISAGIIFMGFGGSSWTSDYAKNMLRYAISSGAKLFVLELIMGLCVDLLEKTIIPATTGQPEQMGEFHTLILLIGVGVAMCVITWSIPNKVQALVNNASFVHSDTVRSIASSAASTAWQKFTGDNQKSNGSSPDSEANRKRDINQNTRAILDSMPKYDKPGPKTR